MNITKLINDMDLGITFFCKFGLHTNKDKFIEIFGQKTGEYLYQKYCDTYNQNIIKFWLYLAPYQRELIIKNFGCSE